MGLTAPVRSLSHMMDPAAEGGYSPNQNSLSGIVGACLSVSPMLAWAEGKGEQRWTHRLTKVGVDRTVHGNQSVCHRHDMATLGRTRSIAKKRWRGCSRIHLPGG